MASHCYRSVVAEEFDMAATSKTSRPFMVTEVAEGVHVLGSLRVNW